MVFSSPAFLYLFLPLVLVGHTLIRNIRWRNAFLCAASLLFYAWGEPVYVLLMVGSTLCNDMLVRAMAGREGRSRRVFLALTVGLNLALLGVFKYTDLVLSTVNSLFRTQIPLAHIALPVGISFFTFQILSYGIDVYRKRIPVQRHFPDLLLYISMFPQLIAGPIVTYETVQRELGERTVSLDAIAEGLTRFATGLAKKILLANGAGRLADALFALPGEALGLYAWLGALAYSLQIYFDFSGYSDMALGLGRALGFTFPENFNYPFIARNVQDFWRRWHISLSTWFRDYLYIPLGGNRRGPWRTACNKIAVFFCTGLWHGANYTFILWGLYNGLFLLMEDALHRLFPRLRLPWGLGIAYTALVTLLGFTLFRADNLAHAGTLFSCLFGGFGWGQNTTVLPLCSPYQLLLLGVGIFASTPLGAGMFRRLPQRVQFPLSRLWALLLLVLSMAAMAASGYNPFIYFRF